MTGGIRYAQNFGLLVIIVRSIWLNQTTKRSLEPIATSRSWRMRMPDLLLPPNQAQSNLIKVDQGSGMSLPWFYEQGDQTFEKWTLPDSMKFNAHFYLLEAKRKE